MNFTTFRPLSETLASFTLAALLTTLAPSAAAVPPAAPATRATDVATPVHPLSAPAQTLIGTPTLTAPGAAPTGAIVLFSTTAGWGDTERHLAQALAARGQLVIGIDLPSTLHRIAATRDDCATLIGEIEAVSHAVQRAAGATAYHFPALAGAQAGATMALEVAGQASVATIARVLAVDPEPTLPGSKPLCAPAMHTAAHTPAAWVLPAGPLPYDVDIRLRSTVAPTARQHAVQSVGARADIHLADTPATSAAAALLDGLSHKVAASGATAVDDLPLEELPVAHHGDTFAVLYSGDGGWRDLDKQVATILQADGLPVVGVDVLRYFWSRRTPEQAAHDLARIIAAYRQKWQADKVVLIGYSFGADVLPALYNRLDASTRAAVVQISLLGFAPMTDFEVTVAGWLQTHSSDAVPTLPEVQRIDARRVQCFYGEEDDSACPKIGAGAEVIRTTGGHHFDGNYEALARRILSGAHRRAHLAYLAHPAH